MKKLAVAILSLLLVATIFQSCAQQKLCPAYSSYPPSAR